MRKLCLLMLVFLITACGYKLAGRTDLPFRSITLKSVQNLTFEPGLQDRFRRVFTDEAISRGLHIDRSGQLVLDVRFIHYSIKTESLRDDLTAEYSISIKADIRASDSQGKTVLEKNGFESEFIETFSATGSIEEIRTRKELATDKALRDLSSRLLSILLYRGGR